MGLKELVLVLIAFALGCVFNVRYPQVGAGILARVPGLGDVG